MGRRWGGGSSGAENTKNYSRDPEARNWPWQAGGRGRHNEGGAQRGGTQGRGTGRGTEEGQTARRPRRPRKEQGGGNRQQRPRGVGRPARGRREGGGCLGPEPPTPARARPRPAQCPRPPAPACCLHSHTGLGSQSLRSSVSPGKFWSPHPHPLRDSRTRRPGRGAGGPLTAVLTHLLAHETPDVVLLAEQRDTWRECRGTASGQGPGPGVSGQGQGSGIRGSHSLSARLLPSRLGGQQGQAAPAGKRGARL